MARIEGFSHFRTDLGEGTRTGVFFDCCGGKCSGVCFPHKLIDEHPFSEDACEKNAYTPSELAAYLKEEKVWYFSKPLGITFLGGEPLRDSAFCKEVGQTLRNAGMSLHIWTCANCYLYDFIRTKEVCDLFVVNLFTVIPHFHKPYKGFDFERVISNLSYLDENHYPFRIRIPVLEQENEKFPSLMASFVSRFENLNSVMLDFSHSTLSSDEQLKYRKEFLDRNIVLY